MIVYAFTDIHINDDLTDEEDEEETATVAVEEHKSVILHLLSQLKLGMDLTRVVLPTFILERRSLLEMFADSMGHPHLFIKLDVVEGLLQNVNLPEHWTPERPPSSDDSLRLQSKNRARFPMQISPTTAKKIPLRPARFVRPVRRDQRYSSQVPCISLNVCFTVTAFYAECRQRQICLNASIWTKSNFSGMSVGVNMIGEVSLFLGEHGEQYDFTLPAAYARSIISIPWIELGGKVNINCPSTGYLANIIFHTKVSTWVTYHLFNM
uniref:(California timema) hypothetical protein n=1 Tax=Timema californicum TaxID=61474 RepID=A0A7R9J0Y2_TIMCA|nr:unnamed protein product [Timema californicum]